MRVTRSTTAATLALVAALAAGALVGCAPGTSSARPGEVAPSSAPSVPASSTPSPSPSGAEESPSASPSATPSPTPTPTPTPTPSPTPTPTAKPVLSPGDTGDQVRELQARLAQLEWFEGKITDSYGDQTEVAVGGFQAKRDLDATGVVDEKTWTALTSMTRQPTDDELHNRLTPGPALFEEGSEGKDVKEIQARLKQIGWFSGKVTGYYGGETATGVKGFQEKRAVPTTGEVDQRTLDRLNAMTREPTEAELTNKPPKKEKTSAGNLDSRCMTGRALCISKATNQMAWVVDGEVQSSFAVRFGSELTPTREGAFSVGWKSRDHVSTIYDTPMPYAMFFSGGQAVHYSADFAARGYNGASHGCVNVRDKAGIASLFDQVGVGDKVIVYR